MKSKFASAQDASVTNSSQLGIKDSKVKNSNQCVLESMKFLEIWYVLVSVIILVITVKCCTSQKSNFHQFHYNKLSLAMCIPRTLDH